MAIRIGISIRSVCLLAQKFLNSRVFSWRSITHESLGMHSYARTIISMIKERKLFNKKGSSSTTGSQSGWKSFCKIHKVQVIWGGHKIRSSCPLPLRKPTIDWKILKKSSFSEKATKIWKNLPIVLTLLSKNILSNHLKQEGDFFQFCGLLIMS